ncbi:MAG: hypothetical protein K940chlam7_01144 [Chlamydiae bacterium]|nr:hypothetical protein [Chlamydiota bacterium]
MDFRPSIPSGIPRKLAYDDSTEAYQKDNLFDLVIPCEKVGDLGPRLFGGHSPGALKPESSPSGAKRFWEKLASPIVWLVHKIIEIFKKIFPGLFKAESKDKDKDKDVGRSNAPKFCPKTVDELIADLTCETDTLKLCVESLDLCRYKDEKSLEAKIQILRDLHAMHFEIVEAFRTISETLSKDRAQTISREQKVELRKIQFKLNGIYAAFKQRLREKPSEIVQIFHKIKDSMTLEQIEKSDLWSLRSYLSILKFINDHTEELFHENTHTEHLDLAIEPSQKSLAIEHVEKFDSIIDQVQQVIDQKVRKLLEAQEKASAAEIASLPQGICNVGNSCYMNSVLQALIGSRLIERLKESFCRCPGYFEEQYEKMKEVFATLDSFKNFYDLDKKESGESLMSDVARQLRETIFRSKLVPDFDLKRITRQQDAASLMEGLLKALGFCFEVRKTLLSLDGVDKSERTEPCHMLRVPISKEDMSFQKAVDNLKEENINDPETPWKVTSDPEGKVILRTHAQRKNEYQIAEKIPDVMVVQLVRFDNNREKIDSAITWESDVVDLSALIDPSLVFEGESTKYRIVSYVNHRGGGTDCGHYTANVRRGGHFYKCDDNSPVVQVSECREKSDRENAYLFVLERVK